MVHRIGDRVPKAEEALFIAWNAEVAGSVTLAGVNFSQDSAVGGAGGAWVNPGAVGAGTVYGNPGAPTVPGVEVALPVIVVMVGLTVLFGVLIAATAYVTRRMRTSPVLVGSLRVAGAPGVVSIDINPLGAVHAVGEEWTARSVDGRPLPRGVRVEVVRQDGLTLYVSPVEPRPAT